MYFVSAEHRILWIRSIFFFQLRIGSTWELFQDFARILISITDPKDGDPVEGPSGISLSGASGQLQEASHQETEGEGWREGWWR